MLFKSKSKTKNPIRKLTKALGEETSRLFIIDSKLLHALVELLIKKGVLSEDEFRKALLNLNDKAINRRVELITNLFKPKS